MHAGGNPAVSQGNMNMVNGFCAKVNASNIHTVGKSSSGQARLATSKNYFDNVGRGDRN